MGPLSALGGTRRERLLQVLDRAAILSCGSRCNLSRRPKGHTVACRVDFIPAWHVSEGSTRLATAARDVTPIEVLYESITWQARSSPGSRDDVSGGRMFHHGSLGRFWWGRLNVPFLVGGSAAGGGSAHPCIASNQLARNATIDARFHLLLLASGYGRPPGPCPVQLLTDNS